MSNVKSEIGADYAPPRPWRIAQSKGGKYFIYADGEEQPLEILKVKKRPTKRETAILRLICDAVNFYTRHAEELAWQKLEGRDGEEAQ